MTPAAMERFRGQIGGCSQASPRSHRLHLADTGLMPEIWHLSGLGSTMTFTLESKGGASRRHDYDNFSTGLYMSSHSARSSARSRPRRDACVIWACAAAASASQPWFTMLNTGCSRFDR
jgi:hypothetical protein